MQVNGFNDYEVFEDGRVWSNKRNKFLFGGVATGGYRVVTLRKNNKSYTKLVHRLVAEGFIPNPDNLPEVHHINEDKTDNRVENLMWVSREENVNAGTRTKRVTTKLSKPVRVFKEGFSQEYPSLNEASRQLGLDAGNLSALIKGLHRTVKGYMAEYTS